MSEQKIDFGQLPFEMSKTDQYFLIKLNGQLDMDLAKEFERRLSSQLPDVTSDILVDLEKCKALHPVFLRLLMQAANHAKAKAKKLRCVDSSGKHSNYFIEQGMASSLMCVSSHRAALADFTAVPAAAKIAPSKKVDVNFINPFLEGTIEVLKIQAKTTAKAGTPYLKDARASFGGDISGVIGLVSDHFTGSVVISFPEQTFLKIMSRMLGEEFTEINADIKDGAAEMTNIIFGHAKRILNEKGYGIKMAIPSVITGKDHSISSTSGSPRVAIPFESDLGNFGIEICLSEPT